MYVLDYKENVHMIAYTRFLEIRQWITTINEMLYFLE